TIVRASRSSTVVTGGMPSPKVIAPSDSTDTSSPLAPRRRRSTRSVCRAHRGGFQPAQRADHEAEVDGRVGRDGAATAGDGGAVEREVHAAACFHLAPANVLVEARDAAGVAGFHGTILEIGSSMMPLAPSSSSSGMRVLISLLATTVSTAKPS